MKNLIILTIYIFQLLSCKSKYSTNQVQVYKINTTTEYLVLNNDFNNMDSSHTQRSVLKFSKTGKVLENVDFFDNQNGQGGGVIYKYDNKDNLIEEFLLDIHKEIYETYKYEYANNTREKYQIYKDGRKVKFQKDEYDSNNNIIKELSFYSNGDSVLSYKLIKYNSNHQITERQHYNDGKLRGVNLITYNNDGLEVENQFLDKKNNTTSITKYIYEEFDSNKNWIKRKRIVNGIPHSIAFQKVELQ